MDLQSHLPANNGSPVITEREQQVLQLLYDGLTSKEIGAKLFLSARTVEDYRQQLMCKADTHNVVGLIRFGLQKGLIKI